MNGAEIEMFTIMMTGITDLIFIDLHRHKMDARTEHNKTLVAHFPFNCFNFPHKCQIYKRSHAHIFYQELK